MSLLDLVLLAAIGMAVLIAAQLLADWIGLFPEILWLTTIALALGQLPSVRKLSGAQQLGNLGLHLFFAVIGIRSLVGAILEVGPSVFYYTLVVVGIHGIFLFLIGRALKASLPMMQWATTPDLASPIWCVEFLEDERGRRRSTI